MGRYEAGKKKFELTNSEFALPSILPFHLVPLPCRREP